MWTPWCNTHNPPLKLKLCLLKPYLRNLKQKRPTHYIFPLASNSELCSTKPFTNKRSCNFSCLLAEKIHPLCWKVSQLLGKTCALHPTFLIFLSSHHPPRITPLFSLSLLYSLQPPMSTVTPVPDTGQGVFMNMTSFKFSHAPPVESRTYG